MTKDDLRLLKYALFWAVIVVIYFGGASWAQGHFRSPLIFWGAAAVALGVFAGAFRHEAEKGISNRRLLGYGLLIAVVFFIALAAIYWVERYSRSPMVAVGVLALWLVLVWAVSRRYTGENAGN